MIKKIKKNKLFYRLKRIYNYMVMINFFIKILILSLPVYCFKYTSKSMLKSTKNISKLNLIPHNDIDYFYNFQDSLLVNGIGYSILKDSTQKSLTEAGLLHSTILGIGLFTFLGLQGYLLCVSYFILGSLVTKIGWNVKKEMGIEEKRDGKRGPENVWGSSAIALICAIMTYIFKDYPELYNAVKIGYVASLVTKLSDTFQSEIGKVFGKTTILITTLEHVPKGTEGAVSLEGYAAGIIGSFILTGIAYLLNFISSPLDYSICILSALIATTAESYIGAIGQNNKKIKWMTNELVNLINTLIGAFIAITLYLVINP